MNYHSYELAHAAVTPLRWGAQGLKMQLQSPLNPFRDMLLPRMIAASCEVFENVTRRYAKPKFGIKETKIFGMPVPINEEIVYKTPFCNLLHFDRDVNVIGRRYDPKVLIVAPMSGHYATLLRGTVEAMIREHNTYITDWADARNVPMTNGPFDLNDFIDTIIEFVHFLGPNTHVIAVCQPAVPVLAATAIMAARKDEMQPASITLMGGPIDTRRNETVVNKLAKTRPIEWFEKNVISHVPFPYPGFMRKVYPGFVQLTGFMQMNLDRHVNAHRNLFQNLVKGDCDSVQQHQTFYEEYLAVMDLPAEFYLQTVATVFQEHALPDGKLVHRNERVDCAAITQTALMTVEGEKDDICGLGQTEAAHDLCRNIPVDEKYHYVQPGVGHYGVFNGTRWRTEIQPRIREFIRTIQFKRMVGNKARGALPYRSLHQDREQIVEYSAAE
ncbi:MULTISPECIES: polyhydroxyalkanoate depolymerase [Rhodomicrobium]|uniref:polyhydroxyalkanoate depolymerase n=1 Tax=Rhodomicrobium TaxID=1068 RepID=UPI000B4BBB8F|nr:MULTISPECIES: polyhydroxyalkanoate depolymerase [Rhodomicrobium]